jgi:hypothetical protein
MGESCMTSDSDNESQENLAFSKSINQICGDITEEIFDDDGGHLRCDFKAIYAKNKKNRRCTLLSKQNKCKVKLVKNFKTSLKCMVFFLE